MEASSLQIIRDFVAETGQLVENADKLPSETAVELYSMYDTAAKFASLYIKDIDPQLRVELSGRQDKNFGSLAFLHNELLHTSYYQRRTDRRLQSFIACY